MDYEELRIAALAILENCTYIDRGFLVPIDTMRDLWLALGQPQSAGMDESNQE